MLKNLFQSKRFFPLFAAQFLGAFNDNLFKNALLAFVAFRLTQQADILSNVAAGLFILPFFLFSASAGWLADKIRRDVLIKILKGTELVLMILAALVFVQQSFWLLVFLLFLMGVQSTFFGPLKYALLPQHLKKEELVLGNALVESSTYFSIVFGSLLGVFLPIPAVVALLVVCAVAGFIASFFVPLSPAPRSEIAFCGNIFSQTGEVISFLKNHRHIYRIILGITWFWMVGVVLVTQLFPLVSQTLNATRGTICFFLILLSAGILAGALSCQKLLQGRVTALFAPVSALGMAVCALLLFALAHDYPRASFPMSLFFFLKAGGGGWFLLAVFLLAFFGGLYVVPLNTMLQTAAPKAFLARIVAGNNIINALGMVLATLFATVVLLLGADISGVFLCLGLAGLGVAFYLCRLLPDHLLRGFLQSVLGLFFRVDAVGLERLRRAGRRVLVVPNHTSLLDGLLVAAFLPEKAVFAVNTQWAQKWYVQLFSLLVRIYPIDPLKPLSLRGVIAELQAGQRVILFPEGRISTTGALMKVYEGAGIVAEKAGAVLLPLRIAGAEFSKFSYLRKKMKTHFFPHISLFLCPPVKLNLPAGLKGRARRREMGKRLYDVMTEMIYRTSPVNETVFNGILRAAAIYGGSQYVVEDVSRRPMTYRGLLTKVYALAFVLKKLFLGEKRVGIMLANSAPSVVSFLALSRLGKTPVMINFSAGTAGVLSACRTVRLKSVLTSRRFIQQAGLEELEKALLTAGLRVIYLEEIKSAVTMPLRMLGFGSYLLRLKSKVSPRQEAVVLFTSGFEGASKAVFLSHRNILANKYQISSVLPFGASDVLMNALPMFHAFGLCVGTLVPLLSGVRTFFYPSPLHYRIVPELSYDINATALCGTDSFLNGYGRLAHPYDFFGLKYAICGGETLKPETRDLWMKKFGVRIFEGYGATETSPVLTLNTPMYFKQDTAGRFLPGIEHRLKPMGPLGDELSVRGDNVMLGYMKEEAPGILQAPKNGWYDTGDLVQIDAEGFVTPIGRVHRMAKIGGEFVALEALEKRLSALYPHTLQGILAVPDARKGERLIFVTQSDSASLDEIRRFLKSAGESALCVPKQIFHIAKMPLLGSGKIDWKRVKELVAQGDKPRRRGRPAGKVTGAGVKKTRAVSRTKKTVKKRREKVVKPIRIITERHERKGRKKKG